MVRSFLLLTFVAANAVAGENDAATRIAAIEARIGGRIGVAALDTGNSKHVEHRADERFPMCSTFKFLAAAAVLKRVDEKKEKLERFVPYGAKVRAGIPKNWVLGDKTGRGSNGATNDIAILRPPDRAPILLAIYFIGSTTPAKDREAAIAEVAKIVAESFVSAVQNTATATSDYQRALDLFDYDAKAPLDLHDKIIEEFNGGTLHDITYASPKGGPIAAYLVVPKSKGPIPAILFGHWGNGTRTEFIPEAKLYARAGAVSLLPDYPWDRPQPWHKTPNHYDKPELDREIEIQAVLELRRGIDLLLARPDVDPKRLAYVGHSYGAQWDSILSAVDKPMKTSVLMAGCGGSCEIFF